MKPNTTLIWTGPLPPHLNDEPKARTTETISWAGPLPERYREHPRRQAWRSTARHPSPASRPHARA